MISIRVLLGSFHKALASYGVSVVQTDSPTPVEIGLLKLFSVIRRKETTCDIPRSLTNTIIVHIHIALSRLLPCPAPALFPHCQICLSASQA